MATYHSLWTSGDPPAFRTPYAKQFPAPPLRKCYPYRPAVEHAGKFYTYYNEINTCEHKHFTDIIEYLNKAKIGVDDVMGLLPIPKTYNLHSVYFENLYPMTGFTGELTVCGLDGATQYIEPFAWDLSDKARGKDDEGNPNWTINTHGSLPVAPGIPGAPLKDGHMTQHAMMELKVTGLAPDATNLCDPCIKSCFGFYVSVSICDNCNITRTDEEMWIECDETGEFIFERD